MPEPRPLCYICMVARVEGGRNASRKKQCRACYLESVRPVSESVDIERARESEDQAVGIHAALRIIDQWQRG